MFKCDILNFRSLVKILGPKVLRLLLLHNPLGYWTEMYHCIVFIFIFNPLFLNFTTDGAFHVSDLPKT